MTQNDYFGTLNRTRRLKTNPTTDMTTFLINGLIDSRVNETDNLTT